MGLDMYLYRKTYVSTYGNRPEMSFPGLEHINPDKVSEVREEVGYWNKANHIHKWFVDNVQDGVGDCGEYYVTEDDLRALLAACEEVIANPRRAGEILPTQSVSFFGATEYDEWYTKDVEDTVRIVKDALSIGSVAEIKLSEEDCYISVWYEYHSSWRTKEEVVPDAPD